MTPERKAALLDTMAKRYPRDEPIVRQLDKLPEPPPRPPKPVLPDCRGMTVGELEDVLRDFSRDAVVMLSSEDGRHDLDVVNAEGHPAGDAVVVLYGVDQGDEADVNGDAPAGTCGFCGRELSPGLCPICDNDE